MRTIETAGTGNGDTRRTFARAARRTGMLALWLVLIASLTALFAPAASAHAILETASPVQDAQLAESPGAVELTFNERLDGGSTARLSVLNGDSKTVASGKPERTSQGKGLRLALPKLGEGHYTVSYSVISADGHPVEGAYVFTVGNPPPLTDAAELDPHAQLGHSSHNHGGDQDLTTTRFIFYASRALFFASLLVLSGLLLWGLRREPSAAERASRETWIGWTAQFGALATLVYVVLQMSNLTEGEPFSEWGRILTDTTVGRLYAAQLVLAFAALLLRGMGAYAGLAWTLLALIAEAWNGHAAAFSPAAYTLALDFVHLLAAAVWSGGLVLLAAVWHRERPEAGRFAIRFSKWALLSFLLLALTGALSTLQYLPTLSYLFETSWGTWLLIKIGLSLLVVVTAFLIRLRLRKGELPRAGLLRADLGMLGAIVLSVGVLTYQNPLPANQPISYHEMGTDMHVTLRISPGAPGDNAFTLKIWLPDKVGAPKKVALRLRPLGSGDVGFIDVPLEAYEDSELDDFPDFAKATFQSKGPYLAFRGRWEAQIRVTDRTDTEIVKSTTFKIY
ncbi:copper resistance protein CopC/CopD [Cohnella ginsengisoli]|uniref:Copper resistance protein CopC/CopD n=1 Tax=Cohnella ginsengisoli TaxID=425004 RepID=A0A9X4QL68_9BACL|nr:copper resistance protein CopC [Cohnella ginsengisoli]MDG0790428.1 copper resistance protein CopC/CopD [Cohnella ginsengisoli]